MSNKLKLKVMSNDFREAANQLESKKGRLGADRNKSLDSGTPNKNA